MKEDDKICWGTLKIDRLKVSNESQCKENISEWFSPFQTSAEELRAYLSMIESKTALFPKSLTGTTQNQKFLTLPSIRLNKDQSDFA
jgi:hypothetical protein